MKSTPVLTLFDPGSRDALFNPHPSARRPLPQENPLWRYIGKAANDAAPTLSAAGITSGPRSLPAKKLQWSGRFATSIRSSSQRSPRRRWSSRRPRHQS